MYAYAEETVRRAMRAEYEDCTCGGCLHAHAIEWPFDEDREALDAGMRGALPSARLEDGWAWCDYVDGMVLRARPVYTDEDGECGAYEPAY